MKKKIFLNLVMGISLIATPALLLASCSAQASDVKLPITKKATPDLVSAEELQVSSITLKTVQKLFDNVDVTSFENVTATLKNGSAVIGTPNNVVLTANDGFVFEDGTENGAKTLESSEFNPSASILPITVKNNSDGILFDDVTATPITLKTVQKLFNIDTDSFKNVSAVLKNGNAAFDGTNQIVLTAKDGFVFENGTNTLESGLFSISFSILPITVKNNSDSILFDEVTASQISITTLQKLFNIDEDSFKNVSAVLKNGNAAFDGTNQIVLTAKDGFVFENGTNTLESGLFSISFSKLLITVIDNPGDISKEEITDPITITMLQKLFNIDADSFKNVNAKVKNAVSVGTTNQVVLTAKDGFVFENGTNTLESGLFSISFSILPITVKNNSDSILFDEVTASQISITTLQKLFNIDEDSFKNVSAAFQMSGDGVVVGSHNKVILTAKDGFVFEDGTENGAKTLESASFKVIASK